MDSLLYTFKKTKDIKEYKSQKKNLESELLSYKKDIKKILNEMESIEPEIAKIIREIEKKEESRTQYQSEQHEQELLYSNGSIKKSLYLEQEEKFKNLYLNSIEDIENLLEKLSNS